MPEFVLQQAYHRFFKEQFDVTVLAKRMPVRQVLDDEYVWNIGMSIGMVGLLSVVWIALLCGWIWG